MTEKLFSKNFTLLVLGQVSSLFGNYIIKPVLYSGVLCFFITATFECFIKLDYIPRTIDRENETWKTVNRSHGTWGVSYSGGYRFQRMKKKPARECYGL